MTALGLSSDTIATLLPCLILFATGCLLLTLSLFAGQSRGERRAIAIGLAGCAASAFAAFRVAEFRSIPGAHEAAAAGVGAVFLDPFAAFLHVLIVVATAVSLLLAGPFLRRTGEYHPEFPSLLVFAASGMSLFVSTTDLLLLFIALELLSLPIYVLAGYQRALPRSNEAALKYFVLGAFSSALFLYGIALVYGATGHANLALLTPLPGTGHLLPAGLLLLLTGFLFKIASVPFHMWTPDVYEGAPTPVTAFMATAVKAAGFGALIRFVWAAIGTPGVPDMTGAFSLLAILTMTVGNLGALTQPNVKRMLAFSSIAHAGYLLVGVAAISAAGRAGGDAGASSILYYLLAYSLTNLAAFGVVIALGGRSARPGAERVRIQDYAGTARRDPALAAVMAIAMLSLAGVPPTAGFFGKYMLFRSAVAQGLTPLVVWGVLNSALSLYYYLGMIVVMYMQPEREPVAAARGFALRALLVSLAVLVIWAGVAPAGTIPGLPDLVGWVETSLVSR
jgi:NADH-quinone oxidoreductase subunit N